MNYTSIEQSKKLLELGLSPESADMKFKYDHNEHRCIEIPMMVVIPNWDDEYNKDIPCWSVGALLEVMPSHLEFENGLCLLNLRKYPQRHEIYYAKDGFAPKGIIEEQSSLDACYQMIVWLLENNYIKKEGNT